MNQFTHLDENGSARMVDVTTKAETRREASARGLVRMKPGTARAVESGGVAKGDVLGTARIAGIMAAKRTSDIIPMCHPLQLTGVDISFDIDVDGGAITIEATVKTVGRTGVEMEAMSAVGVAALAIYDMCKSADREITISDVRLVRKSGGKSGTFERESEWRES